MADSNELKIDPRSGFCKSNTTFYSKRKPVALPPADESLDVTTFISSRQHHHNGQVALIDAITGQKLTYAQVWTAVDSVAKCLSDLGIRKGHVILLLSPNSIFFPVICLSVFSVGAIITTANPLNTAGEISKQISDSKPVLAFTVPKLLPKLFEACNHIPTVIFGGESNATNIVDKLENMMKQEISQNQNRVKNRVTQSDVATMLYSSGTTGTSKGVMSSHRNFIALVQSGKNRFRLNDTLVCTVPLFHIFGLGGIMMNLGIGATTVILSKFDLDDLLSSVQKYKATYLPLVPPILISLVNEADEIKRRYDLSSLKAVLCGGASLRKEVIESFVDEYPGIAILQGYAMTESAGGGASTDTMEESLRYGTVGLLTQCMEARIVDPDTGKLLPVNQTGELWLRGPTVMTGYFSKEEATTSTLSSDGWLRTGDICYFDDDGFLFIVDRLKELIKYKGYQVAPAELEALLLCHQEIADACVIPFPDKEVGQFPMAYVVRKSGSYLTEKAIKDFVAKQVAPYKKIRRVAFITSVPRNPSGKILRKDLIKLATSKL